MAATRASRPRLRWPWAFFGIFLGLALSAGTLFAVPQLRSRILATSDPKAVASAAGPSSWIWEYGRSNVALLTWSRSGSQLAGSFLYWDGRCPATVGNLEGSEGNSGLTLQSLGVTMTAHQSGDELTIDGFPPNRGKPTTLVPGSLALYSSETGC
jgi:hypothetical protein